MDGGVRLARTVLLILGVVDIIRGVMHTFVFTWAAENIAKIDPHPDALMLLGVFGNSNFLTSAVYLLIAIKAREIAGYVLEFIPFAYFVGIVGVRTNGVTMQSAFNGQYMMFVYFAVCIVAFVYFAFFGPAVRRYSNGRSVVKSKPYIHDENRQDERVRLLPSSLDNTYRGSRIAVGFFIVLTAFTLARSLIHIVAPDGGAQSIATIPLDSFTTNGAAALVHLFALWGLPQLIIGIVYVIALVRYRSFLPLL